MKDAVYLSVLIDSGIDCCFKQDTKYWQWRSEYDFDPVKHRVMPRMNYWFCDSNFGVSSFSLIRSLERAGFDVEWYDNIGGFRINGLQDGYCWPWECE